MTKNGRCALALWLSAAVTQQVVADGLTDRQEDVGKAGDTLQYVVPLAALALTFVLKATPSDAPAGLNSHDLLHLNGTPRHDLALAMGRTVLVTEALKFAVNEKRPNGASHSFPSGHTSFAFSGAEFIRKEYGWAWGVPAYLTAGFVGWSRVESDEHHTRDVLAGAAIGILANHDLRDFKTRYGSLSLQSAPVATQFRSVPGLQFKLAF